MLNGKDAALYAAPTDRAAVIVAAHTLCSHPTFLKSFLSADGLVALCELVRPALDDQRDHSIDRVMSGSGVFATAERRASAHTPASSSDTESQTPPTMAPLLPGGVHRVVWNAAIRTIAKLMVCSTSACALSIDTGSLALLAKAAAPAEPMDIRLRAAAGLAAIAAWSGPRRAVEIVQTEDVVNSMTAILSEQDERIPNDLRTATIDGLVVMSFRRHARGLLEKHGCEEKIKAAARHATMSGDYAAAARNTVAAGQFTGRSVDEYGFLVEDADKNEGSNSSSNNLASNSKEDPRTSDDDILRKKPTGLRHIHQQLLEEPYTWMEDLNVLEEIVHEDAGLLSSSPRDRNYIRRAARTYGVSADEIEFISVLEEEASPLKKLQTMPDDTNLPAAISVTKETKETIDEIVPVSQKRSGHSATGSMDSKIEAGSVAENAISEKVESLLNKPPSTGPHSQNNPAATSGRTSTSSPRVSSSFFPVMQDPDFDRAENAEDDDSPSSSKSKGVSPLMMFSSATKRAAEKDNKNNHLQRSDSQLNRDTENERVWKDVLDNKREMLRRERGRSSRVVAYRELALVPVPPALRRRLWPLLLDTASLRNSRPGLYKELCKNAEATLPDDIEHTIDADVTRTMPLHSLFWAGGAQVGVTSLRSILRAYARYVPEVGYCQGMSSIAAVLLMNSSDEEEAFLMLVQFMSRFQYKKVFAPGFPLMLQWISELKPLVAHYMPEVSAHLDRENVTLELYADKWLITALSHNFPHRYLLRVWDLMFLGGSPKIILKACLAVLKRCEKRLLEMDFERLMTFLQRRFAEAEEGVLDAKDAEPFINEMREFRFLPDLPKTASMASAPATSSGQAEGGKKATSNGVAGDNNGRKNNESRRERRGGCLPCFRRSPTLD